MIRRPFPSSLEPLGFGSVLDTAIGVFRRSYWYFVVVVALCGVPASVITIGTNAAALASGPSALLAVEIAQWPFRLANIVLAVLEYGAIIALAAQVYPGDGRPDWIAAYRLALSRGARFLVTILLWGLATLVGTVLLVVPGILAAVWLSQAPMLVITDNLRPLAALRASCRLARGSFWRLVGIYLVTTVMVGLVVGFVAVPLGGAFVATHGGGTGGFPGTARGATVVSVVTAVADMLVFAFPTVALYVQFVDLRVRREGWGLDPAVEAGPYD